jgi:hypothetical protein
MGLPKAVTVTAADKLFVWVTIVPAAKFSAADRETTGGGGLGKIFTGVTPPILIPPSVVVDFGGRRILKFTSVHWEKNAGHAMRKADTCEQENC